MTDNVTYSHRGVYIAMIANRSDTIIAIRIQEISLLTFIIASFLIWILTIVCKATVLHPLQ